jgi:hypothetical protein
LQFCFVSFFYLTSNFYCFFETYKKTNKPKEKYIT